MTQDVQSQGDLTEDTTDLGITTRGSQYLTEPICAATAVELIQPEVAIRISVRQEWLQKFRQEPPTGQSLMLMGLLDSFNDGEEGVMISFREL